MMAPAFRCFRFLIIGLITEKVLKNLSTEIDKAVADIFGAFPIPPLGTQTTADR